MIEMCALVSYLIEFVLRMVFFFLTRPYQLKIDSEWPRKERRVRRMIFFALFEPSIWVENLLLCLCYGLGKNRTVNSSSPNSVDGVFGPGSQLTCDGNGLQSESTWTNMNMRARSWLKTVRDCAPPYASCPFVSTFIWYIPGDKNERTPTILNCRSF